MRALPGPQNGSSVEVPATATGTIATGTALVEDLATGVNLQVTDADRNSKPTVVESFPVHLSSLADPLGIDVVVRETSPSASTFDLASAPLRLTTAPSDPGAARLHVWPSDDVVTVTYRDPAPRRERHLRRARRERTIGGRAS